MLEPIQKEFLNPSPEALLPLHSLSLRDPAGKLFDYNGRLLRGISREGLPCLQAVRKSASVQKWISQGKFIPVLDLNSSEKTQLLKELKQQSQSDFVELVEHPKVPFVSFPQEWTPEMLCAAGQMTLEFSKELLKEGLGLKDATPFNILFSGTKPVFVDALSVEARHPSDPIWLAYHQFVRTFLNPLLAFKHFGLGLPHAFTLNREGMASEELYALCGSVRRFLPPFLNLVSIPTWLSSTKKSQSTASQRAQPKTDPEATRFILNSLFKRLGRSLGKQSPKPKQNSVWSKYMGKTLPYTCGQLSQKETFIESVVKDTHAKKVLDVGCNTGHFSFIAAKQGASVVAIDFDPHVVSQTYFGAKEQNLDILPLVVDISCPSPSVGWWNQESPSFLQRAKGSFDLVLMLAVIHHLMASAGIPLIEILKLAASMTRQFVVMEFIEPNDRMFQTIARGRDYSHLTQQYFEQQALKFFSIEKCVQVESGHRHLYVLRKR